MTTPRAVLIGVLVGAVFAAISCRSADPCETIVCGAGLTCNPSTRSCKSSGTAVGCPTTCSGATPLCDTASSSCKACTATAGCTALLPHCDTSTAAGRCVECLDSSHCPGGACDPASHACGATGTGGGVGGGTGGGAGGGGGNEEPPDAGLCAHACPAAKPVCDPGTGLCGQCGQDSDCTTGWNKACVNHVCELQPNPFRPDGGACVNNSYAGGSCNPECDRGFSCVAGACQLNGSQGAVQVTLRFDQGEDLDLHVDEPGAAGVCEIYYGDPNEAPDAGGLNPSSCGALGWLDLDSNAGCSPPLDNVDIENVIYPAGQPAPSGTYRVRVDYYDNCTAITPIPFEVTIRANGTTTTYCDVFNPNESDQGSAGDGRPIASFVVP